MERRSRALETSGDQPEASNPKTTSKKMHQEAYSSTVEHSANCQTKECSGSPSISPCDRYKQMGTREKKAVVKKLKLCMNCLGRYFVADCPAKFSCRFCNGRHQTSLHFDRPVEQQSGVTSIHLCFCQQQLADKNFHQPGPVHFLLGADVLGLRGSLSRPKEEGSWVSLSQIDLWLGGHWSVVPRACLSMSIFPNCSGTGSCSRLGS